jgi:HPt (histidine-containing phosphotransfer) domain-containing protein
MRVKQPLLKLCAIIWKGIRKSPQKVLGNHRGIMKKDKDIFDLEILKSRLSGDGDLAIDITRSFINDIRPLFIEISEALTVLDYEKICFLAHQIKGGAANVGAMSLSVTGKKLQLASKAKNEINCKIYSSLIKEDYKEFSDYVKKNS